MATYRVRVTAGPYSWTVTDDDPPTLGLADPLVIAWSLPTDAVRPAQPDPVVCQFSVVAAAAADVQLGLGDQVEASVWFAAEQLPPDTDPPDVWFRGRITDGAAEVAPGGRMLYAFTCSDQSIDLTGADVGADVYPPATWSARLAAFSDQASPALVPPAGSPLVGQVLADPRIAAGIDPALWVDQRDSSPDPVLDAVTELFSWTAFTGTGPYAGNTFYMPIVAAGPGLVGGAPPAPTYTETVLADDPLVYLRLGDAAGATVATDASGNGHPGTYNGAPTLGVPSLIAGDPADTCMTTDGATNQSAQVPYDDWLQTGRVTVEAWVKPSTVAAGLADICSRRDANAANGPLESWRLTRNGTGLEFRIWYSAGPGTAIVTAAGVFTAGVTRHICAVYDGTALRLYADGVELATTPLVDVLNAGQRDLWVGRNAATNMQRWAGSIDEVAVYGVGLSPARIAAHYTAGSTPPPAGSGPGAYYPVAWDALSDRFVPSGGAPAPATFGVVQTGPDRYGVIVSDDDRFAGVLDACYLELGSTWTAIRTDVVNTAVIKWATAAAADPEVNKRTPRATRVTEIPPPPGQAPVLSTRDTGIVGLTGTAGTVTAAQVNADRLGHLMTPPFQEQNGWSPDAFTWRLDKDDLGRDAFPVIFPQTYRTMTAGGQIMRTICYVRPIVVTNVPAAWNLTDPTSDRVYGQLAECRLAIAEGAPTLEIVLTPTLPETGGPAGSRLSWNATPGTWDAQVGVWDDLAPGYQAFLWDDPALTVTWDQLYTGDSWIDYQLLRGT